MKRRWCTILMLATILILVFGTKILAKASTYSEFFLANNDTIVDSEDIIFNSISGSGVIVVDNNANVTLSNLTITLNECQVDSVFVVESGKLVLDNVTVVNNSSTIGDIIINNGGVVELNEIDFPVGLRKIINNADGDNIILHTIANKDIDTITLNSGSVMVLEDTTIDGVINLDLNINLSTATEKYDNMIGRVLVKGCNTYASFYKDHFSLKTATSAEDQNYYVNLCNGYYYMDYVGYIGDDITVYNDGYQVKYTDSDSNVTNVDIIESGDLIFTKFVIKENSTPCGGLYATANAYLEHGNATHLVYGNVIDVEKENNYYYNSCFALDNVTTLLGHTKKHTIGTFTNESLEIFEHNIDIVSPDTEITTQTFTVCNQSKLGFSVAKNGNDLDNVVVDDNITRVVTIENAKIVYLMLQFNSVVTTKTQVILKAQAPIVSDIEIANVDDEIEYNGQDRTAQIQPYYMNGNEKVVVDASNFKITKDGEIVSEIKNVGEYTIFLINTETMNFAPNSYVVNVIPKKITATFADSIFDYDGTAKSVTATLNGVCADDVVEINYSSNNSQTTPGTNIVSITIDNPNYSLIGDTQVNLIVRKKIVDMSAVKFEDINATYAENITYTALATNVPELVNVVYENNSQNMVCTENSEKRYRARAIFSIKSEYDDLYKLNDADVVKICYITISPQTIDMSGISVPEIHHVYDGQKVTAQYSGVLPNRVSSVVSFKYYSDYPNGMTYNTPINATNTYYTVEAGFQVIDSRNYVLSQSIILSKIYISQAPYDMENVVYNDASFEYDGEIHKCIPKFNEMDISVEFLSAGEKNIGTYKQSIKCMLINSNYYFADSNILTATLEITPKQVSMDGIYLNDVTVSYEPGEKVALKLSGSLPENVLVVYNYYLKENLVSFDGVVDAGNYEVVAKFTLNVPDPEVYEPISDIRAKLIINPINVNLKDCKFENDTIVYDGQPHNLTIINLPDIINAEYSAKDLINVGEYTILAELNYDRTNYNITNVCNLSAQLNITRAKYDMSSVKFESINDTYDGIEHVVEVTGNLPSGLEIKEYTNNNRINAGKSNAQVSFKNTNTNYYDVEPMRCLITISPKIVDIALKANSFEYTGKNISVEAIATGVISGDMLDINLDNKTNSEAGRYFASVIDLGNDNYVARNNSLEYVINKATVSLDKLSFDDVVVTYDGLDHSPKLMGSDSLPNGVIVSVIKPKMINVGEYIAIAEFQMVNNNYIKPDNLIAKTTINPKPILVQFDGYRGLIADGTQKNITISFIGLLEIDFDDYKVIYNASPIDPGKYICSVQLHESTNYEIIGNASIEFEILTTQKIYVGNDIEVVVEGDGFQCDKEIVLSEIDNEKLQTRMSDLKFGIARFDAFKINIEDAQSNQDLKVSLKTNSVNINNARYIKVYKVVNNELKSIDFQIKNNKLLFDAKVSDEIIVVEATTMIVQNEIISVFIIVMSGLSLVAISRFALVFVMTKKKKQVKFFIDINNDKI